MPHQIEWQLLRGKVTSISHSDRRLMLSVLARHQLPANPPV
jgi:hypothetical protein